jgi:glycine/D-amino acid oxidase-like deaminating enzyme
MAAIIRVDNVTFNAHHLPGRLCDEMKRNQLNKRRNVLKAMGASALTATIGACATPVSQSLRYARPHSRQPFVAPRISEDRVIRAIVGSRPYRPSGFVVKAEKYDDKTVIHNYGHGGGGITMSWGSSALALRETVGMAERNAAVIGSGIMGLTTARLLQDAGWQVTIHTREPARHTTSNVGAGQWAPTSVFDEKVATPAFKSRFNWAARVAHHAFTNLGGAEYGIRWRENYYLGNEPIEWSYYLRELPDLFASVADLEPGEHPFPMRYVRRTVTMLIDPATFLRQVFEDFLQAGGQFVIRDFADLGEVLTLEEAVIFNCTGLGAKSLFGDEELTPIKGQLLFLPPDPAVDFLTVGGGVVGGGGDILYMFPRTDALVLGGTWKMGDPSRHVEAAESERILYGNKRIFDQFG